MRSSITSVVVWQELNAEQQRQRLARPVQSTSARLSAQVQAICTEVRNRGDAALLEYTERFDGVNLTSVELSASMISDIAEQTPESVKSAIDQAYDNIYAFHLAQRPQDVAVTTMPGIDCELRFAALEKVGLYIPGGTASLPSTVLMLGVPAQIAECPERVLVSPPSKEGKLTPAICYAARKCGITRVFLAGGAQAIAALAFGTETIPAVDKIFGPGNSYVTEAKQQVSQVAGGPAIDLPAGPSELLVIADDSADADFVAADLLSQAEHGADSQVLCLSPSAKLLDKVRQALARQLEALPRKDIAVQALEASSLILTADMNEAVAISQAYAPEHLSIQVTDAAPLVNRLTRAGSLFVGHYTPESGGDYATGTNHVLPTYGFARNYSSLGLLDFYRRYTVQTVSPSGLKALGPSIIALAGEEKLDAHLRAVSLRLESDRFQQDLSREQEANA